MRAIASLLSVAFITFAPQAPSPRDNAPMGAVGSGAITGRIIDGASRGVPRAIVALAGTGDSSRAVITDDEGRFALTNLPAGRFLIRAQKPAYITTLYGSKRPGSGLATTVVLGAGQRIDGVVITMLHGAAITGRVVSEFGRPLAQMFVRAMQYQYRDGERTLVSLPASGITDDRGIYRLYGLVPGDYLVALEPASQISAHLMTPADGVAAPPNPDADSRAGYASLFYPGSPDPSSASVVTLAAGEERAGLDFTARFISLATVEGVVTKPSDAGAGPVRVSVTPTGSSAYGMMLMTTTAKPDGSFSLTGLAPGSYKVSALLRQTGDRATRWMAATTLFVDGGGLKRVSLNLEPGVTVSGRIVFDSATAQAPDPRRGLVEMAPTERAVANAFGMTTGSIEADGSFTIRSVVPGPYKIIVQGPGASPPASVGPWPVKSVTLDGRNLQDFPFDVRPGTDVSGIVVTLTDKVTQVSGVVQDAAGRPAPDYFLVVFTKDRQFWTGRSRYISSLIHPNSDGAFTVTGLPPGEYFMGAAVDLVADDLGNPDVLAQLATQAISITLAEGEKKVQNLRIGG